VSAFIDGEWRGDPEYADQDQLYARLQESFGPDADPQEGESAEHYFTRMQAADLLFIADTTVPVTERLAQHHALREATARGAVVIEQGPAPDADPLAEKAAEMRALPITERFAAYKQRRAEFLQDGL